VESPEAGRLSTRRVALGWALTLLGMPLLTAVLVHLVAGSARIALATMLFLSLAVLTALVGGRLPALVAAVVGAMLLNYFFVPPLHTFDVAATADLCALVVFALTAVAVAAVVDAAARRREQAGAAEHEADTLAMLNRQVLGGEFDLPQLLGLARDTFGADSVDLVTSAPEDVADTVVLPAGQGAWLVLNGGALGPRERSIAAAFASHVGVLREREELARQSLAARELEAGNRTRTALLAAVSHDLRTPLAGLRSAVDTLRTHGQRLAVDERRQLLDAIDVSVSRLTTMVSDLLDMSRLQTGAVTPIADDVPLREVIRRSLQGLDGADRVEVGELPTAYVDAGLLEHAIGNLVANALRYSPTVEVTGEIRGRRVVLSIVDHGPGIGHADRAGVFQPFQRHRDVAPEADGVPGGGGGGVGLGLAVARGLTEAQGGTLEAAPTPGGGLTMVLDLPGTAS
jgi:two-component system, OmpR family, sensor histidine kinase KdpD